MGIGGISITQLLIILAIVLLLFGTKRLRNIGSDLGSAIKGFKKSMKDPASEQQTENKADPNTTLEQPDNSSIEGEVTKKVVGEDQQKASTQTQDKDTRP